MHGALNAYSCAKLKPQQRMWLSVHCASSQFCVALRNSSFFDDFTLTLQPAERRLALLNSLGCTFAPQTQGTALHLERTHHPMQSRPYNTRTHTFSPVLRTISATSPPPPVLLLYGCLPPTLPLASSPFTLVAACCSAEGSLSWPCYSSQRLGAL